MVNFSNNLVGLLNILTFLLSIPILVVGIWLGHHGTTECENFFNKPVIALGVFLMIVSLAGLIGACCRVTWLLWVYLFVMFVLIVAVFCFTIFAFVVTNKGAGQVLSDRGYREYRLGDYSNWLQKRVSSSKNWREIRSCLATGNVCEPYRAVYENITAETFYQNNLTPIQSGCCKPSDDCGFTYVSPTEWTKTNTSSTNPDCTIWSNDWNGLCFDCDSCKAGLLENIKHSWKKVAIVNIVFLLVLMTVYTVGCCAFRNSRRENSFRKYQWKP